MKEKMKGKGRREGGKEGSKELRNEKGSDGSEWKARKKKEKGTNC